MTQEELEIIRQRSKAKPPKAASIVLCCLRNGQLIHPDDLGADESLTFKVYAETVAEAIRDRQSLLDWIARDFELPWAEEAP